MHTNKIFILLISKNNKEIFKAHFINTVNTIKGFSKNNFNVYVCFKGFNINKIIKLYNLEKFDNLFYNKFENYNDLYIIIKKNNIENVYCRDIEFPLFLLKNNFNNIINIESHAETPYKRLIPYKNRINFITINEKIKNKWDFPNCIVHPCAIDFDFFSQSPNKLLNFNNNKFNICYAGHVYPYKGIPILVELANKLDNIFIHIIGGYENDIKNYKNLPNNIKFYGMKSQSEMKKYLFSCDLLILPYTNKHFQSKTTSPIKLFEYLSTGKPILSSNIDGIKKWGCDFLNYYEADNLNDLIKMISYIKENYKNINSDHEQNKRKEYAKKFSCEERCKKILFTN